jgi:hypothetical protein
MVRPTGKQSVSAFEKRPFDYEPTADDIGPNSWKWRWNRPEVLTTYEQAKSYWDRHPRTIEGLTFVIHPFGKHEPRTRLICIDFDNAIKEDIDPEVAGLIDVLGSYTELSKSGQGLHTFILVEDCPAFANCLRKPYGGCKVDLLCSNPVNVTGEVYNGLDELVTIPFSTLEALSFFEFKEPMSGRQEKPEWWSENPLEDVPPHLEEFIPWMEMETAVEGDGGSLTLFASACRLMRHGIVGREAEALLRLVPAEPPFPPEQIQRAIECAFNQTNHDGEFNNPTPEFEATKVEDVEEEDREKLFGYNFVTGDELLAKDLKLEYLVDQAFVGEGTMFIGGDQKTFKTNLSVDLLVSLATGTPFLNHFKVNSTRSSAIFTAEIGEVKAQLLLRSILDSRGLNRVSGIDIVNEVPMFGTDKKNGVATGIHIKRLRMFLKTRKPQVVVFDPLYLMMIGGEAGDLYGMGATLNTLRDLCAEFGVWAIFCHHSRKTTNESEFQPMRLTNFYGSGPAQYARQWCLVAHSEPFHHGVANLYATIGGSTQSREDIYEVKIDEGITDELADRRWDVTVKEAEEDNSGPTLASVLAALDGLKPVSPAELAIHLGCNGQHKVVEKYLHELVRDGRVDMRNKKFELSTGGFPE